MSRLQWYVSRLGRMSAAEVAYRATQTARSSVRRWTPAGAPPAPEANLRQARDAGAYVHLASPLDTRRYVAEAQAILRGEFDIFDLRACRLHDEPRPRRNGKGECTGGAALPQWNRDPLTGRHAPLRHASLLDHRDERVVGNIKYLWEPNRHLHLPRLAQAYALTGELRYARALQAHVTSWIEQCPYGRGPNWSSSLELAIRLINWSVAWQLLGGADSVLFGGADGQAFRAHWLRSIHQHARAIRSMLSRYSSANNHLIGECAGVWIASLTWDYWPQMRRWGGYCREVLEVEIVRQNAEDGGNREQAFGYQQFVLDFLLLAGLAGRAAGQDFSLRYWRRVEAMLDFLAGMMDVAGRVPMVGDADDGCVVRLSAEPDFDNHRSLLATGALLFERPDFLDRAGRVDDKTRWLLAERADRYEAEAVPRGGGRVPAHADADTGVDVGADTDTDIGAGTGTGTAVAAHEDGTARSSFRAFPQSGYYLMGERFGTAGEIRLLADAGPLGYLSIAAHGHADALSIVLSVAGHEVLVDPGTYAYHTDPEWRRYFRSTRAHNTVEVDGQDQSRQSGNFMWSRHAQARCLVFEANAAQQRFIGEHDGYRALADPVTHRREILYRPGERTFEIIDTLDCAARHEVIRRWHFAESLMPELLAQEIHVQAGGWRVRLVAMEPLHAALFWRGANEREGGWVSRRFGHKVPATTAGWLSRIQGTTRLRTLIHCEPAGTAGTSSPT